MGIMFQNYTLANVFGLVLFIVVLLGVNEVTRRSKLASYVVYCVAPIVLAILVFGVGVLGSPTGKTWFGWVKVVSALIGVYGFFLIRHTSLGQKKFASIFPVTILSLNIAEAVYREFQVFFDYPEQVVDAGGSIIQGGLWNILNAVSGILCIVMLVGFVGIRVSKDKTRDMIWPDMTWIYIVAYTLWNVAYVLNCISIRSMYAGVGILTAALIAEFVLKQGTWLVHRAQILSVYAMFSLSVDYMKSPLLNIEPTYNTTGLMLVSSVAFAFNVGAAIYIYAKVIKQKKNPLTHEILTETKYYKKTMTVNHLN